MGAVFSGVFSDRYGRQRLMLLAGLLFTVSAIGVGLANQFATCWPYRGWPWSLINTCGFRKPISYFVQSLYSGKPMVYISVFEKALSDSIKNMESWSKLWAAPACTSHWNHTSSEEKEISVLTYSNCTSVELWLNEKLIGEKFLKDFADKVIRWKVPTTPGN